MSAHAFGPHGHPLWQLEHVHDATGGAAQNARLAMQRALVVRDVLMAAGVPEAQIDLKKPEQVSGSGSDAQARRVEISRQ